MPCWAARSLCRSVEGRVALRIPELTPNGRQIRLAGKGMPVLGSADKRGDLFVRTRVQLPEKLSAEEREHFEAMRGGKLKVEKDED
jgi:DnaJ-class molecular chaperone